MFKYVLKRLGLVIFSFFVILLICFFLIKLLPNPVPNVFGQDLELVLKRREALGYNEPIIVQFFIFLKNVLVYQDWGMSEKMYFGSDVWETFLDKLPATMIVNFYAMLVSVPIGLGLGIFAALKKNKWQDHVISTGVMIFISVPGLVTAFLVQYVFCFLLGLFPLYMKAGFDYFTWPMFKSMMPAVIAMSFGSIAGYARFTRAELTEVLTSDFMLLARTKGLTRRQATVHHALRNAMVPIFPSIVGEFVAVLSGSLIIERIFSIPGVGGLYLDSITYQDYDFFMLLSSFYILIGLFAAIFIDLSYGIIDPRIRMGVK